MNDLPNVAFRRMESECQNPGCGALFEREVGSIDGRMLPGPKVCPACQEAQDSEERAFQDAPRDYRSHLDVMADLGLNTRKHGTLPNGIPATLENLGGSEASQVSLWIRDVVQAEPHEFVQGLYLDGPTGTGKTQLCASAVRELLELGYDSSRIVYDRARALVTTVQDRYGTGTVDPLLDRRRLAGVWILDDIGTEKETQDAYRILEDLLDAREGHPTLLSSNLGRSALAARWAPSDSEGRFRSRLGPQNFQHLPVHGGDRRFEVA